MCALGTPPRDVPPVHCLFVHHITHVYIYLGDEAEHGLSVLLKYEMTIEQLCSGRITGKTLSHKHMLFAELLHPLLLELQKRISLHS